MKWVIRYLQGTCSFGLHFTSTAASGLVSYSNAHWGGCPDTRRSTFGYCVFLDDNLISWSSKRQNTILWFVPRQSIELLHIL